MRTSMNAPFRLNFLVLSIVVQLMPQNVVSQGTFQNLNFESATVPIIPAGEFGSHVTVAQGIPGWTAYLPGLTTVTEIGHNDLSLGGAYIMIQKPQ